MERFSHRFRAMGCENSIELYADDSRAAREVSDQLVKDVRNVEEKFSRYLPNSITSKINNSAGSGEYIEIDEETGSLLDFAAVCFEQSRGLFDITSGVLRRAWNFSDKVVPEPALIDSLIGLIGWQKVEWRRPFLRLPIAGMEIDFGGLGKEYAVDKAAGLAYELGVQHAYLNLGGDVRVLGPHPDGKPWAIGIVHPRSEGAPIASIAISKGALATSGDYERYFIQDGQRYCHILNPKTGRPVADLQAVSVLAESCLVAGTAATISMLLGEKAGRRFLASQNLRTIMVDSAGRVLTSRVEDHPARFAEGRTEPSTNR